MTNKDLSYEETTKRRKIGNAFKSIRERLGISVKDIAYSISVRPAGKEPKRVNSIVKRIKNFEDGKFGEYAASHFGIRGFTIDFGDFIKYAGKLYDESIKLHESESLTSIFLQKIPEAQNVFAKPDKNEKNRVHELLGAIEKGEYFIKPKTEIEDANIAKKEKNPPRK